MPYLIAYDIQNDKTRLKVANALLSFGFERIQKSLFVGCPNNTLLQKIITFFEKKILIILTSEDNVLILKLGNENLENATLYPNSPEIWEELKGTKTVLIF
jgi:CRISPR-associated endonuclease Cas2